MRKKKSFSCIHFTIQCIKYLWMAYVQIKYKHISKWKIELKENKEGKHRTWKDTDELKRPQDNWFWDWAIDITKESFCHKKPKNFSLHFTHIIILVTSRDTQGSTNWFIAFFSDTAFKEIFLQDTDNWLQEDSPFKAYQNQSNCLQELSKSKYI